MSANGWPQILLYSLAILAVTKALVNIQLGEVIFVWCRHRDQQEEHS